MKNRIIIVLFAYFFLNIFCAVNGQETLYLWPGKVPGEAKEKAEPVISDNKKGDVKRLSEVTNPLMKVYQPAKGKNKGIGIIICPGGGYSILAIDKEGYEVAEWLSGLGYTSFVLQYRVPQKQEGALMDAQRAVRIVRAHAEKWNIHPDKIGMMGFSAGGSLTARTSSLYDKQMYDPVDEQDKRSCKPDFSMLIYPAYLDKGENRSLTPELEVDSLMSPMFIFAATNDGHANSALVMAGALRDAKVPLELHLMPEGGHGYGLRPGNVAAETWPGLLEKWLMRYIIKK